MSGITSGVGIFSGINRNQIIDQLLAIDARPRTQAQLQIGKLQKYQAAFLDVTGKAAGLRGLAQKFRTANAFLAAKATSGNPDVLKATASNGAPTGQYLVTAARLASTQQMLTRGFSDSNVSGLGLTEMTIEDARGRMTTDTALANLNGGNGVQRGKITIQDRAGTNYTVDLSRATTLNDVMTAINDATGGKVKATIGTVDNVPSNIYAGHGLRLDDSSGGAGTLTVSEVGGTHTAVDLGLLGNGGATTFINGKRINTIGANTRLSTLNDGLGVGISNTAGTGINTTTDFTITARNGTAIQVDIGDMYDGASTRIAVPATTLGEVVNRINSDDQNGGRVVASINANGNLVLTDTTGGAGALSVAAVGSSTAAADLGILGSIAGNNLTGSSLISKLNTIATGRLQGGTGIVDDPVQVTTRTGQVIVFDELDTTGSITDFINTFNNDAQNTILPSGKRKIELGIDASGTRFTLTDNTGGTGNMSVSGGIELVLGFSGVSGRGDQLISGRAQRKFVSENTKLADLNGGRGIGEGSFEITSSTGQLIRVDITSSQKTVGDLISRINSAGGTQVKAKLNDQGDGILIEEFTAGMGANKISIKDLTGTVGRNLNIIGTATGTGASNFINGTAERRITFNAGDTLDTVRQKIIDANAGVSVSIINDGGANPFRLSISSRNSGLAGALSIDTAGVNLGFSTVAEARNALMFYGSADAANAVAIESNTNSITNAIPGVTVDLTSVSATPVTVSVTTDTEAIVKDLNGFVEAYNALIDAIDSKSKYDAESNKRGDLLGDSNAQSVRRTIQDLVQKKAFGVNSQYQYLFEVGLKLGAGGKLSLDETKLRTALERDPRGVADLFAGRAQGTSTTSRPVLDANGVPIPGASVTETTQGAITMRGVMEIFADEMEKFTKSVSGSFARRTSLVDSQIKSQNDRIATIDKRLESRRARLQKQFIAMESAIGRLQGQGSSLSSIQSASLLGR